MEAAADTDVTVKAVKSQLAEKCRQFHFVLTAAGSVQRHFYGAERRIDSRPAKGLFVTVYSHLKVI